MFVAANRFRVIPEHAAEFEQDKPRAEPFLRILVELVVLRDR